MRVTLISFDNWGFNKHIADALERKGYVVNHIDFHLFVYKYPDFYTKIYNFILKNVLKKNLKNIYYGKEIIKKLQQIGEKQDLVLTIKGDFIDPKYLKEIKKYTQKSIGYFNDNSVRCPKIIKAIPCFDEVFSFEKEDCKKYNLNFLTNWIYVEAPTKTTTNFEYEIFNISTKDKRLPILFKISKNLKDLKIDYKFLVLDKQKPTTKDGIEFFANKISLEEVSILIAKSKTLLDINRKGQKGLTFRVFESLGLKKKLITTNSDIVNYDFYNPNNILLVDENNPIIPLSFFESAYVDIPESIYRKYSLDGWINQVFLL
ncbi:MAG: hypothetical protein JHC39_05095 [Lentimicrobium sp.]|jgi:hypothetical protein|nr:hypothetical protein [Lentimicrobium sp.]